MKGGRRGRERLFLPPFLLSLPPLPSSSLPCAILTLVCCLVHHFVTFSTSEAIPNKLLYLWEETLATEEWKRKEHL